MTSLLTPDICVIGAGSAGLTVAAAAAAFGVPVVLVERDRMGGDCLNVGCVPSKALVAAAHSAAAIRRAPRFGVTAGDPSIDPQAVHAHIHAVIDAIAPHDSVERFQALGVTVIRASARFLDRDTVEAGDVRIKARRFVLAIGSSPAVPPIPGLDAISYHTNETIFDQTEIPDHLAIVGGGPIGMEMAQAYRRLGARVTVLEAGRVLANDDPEFKSVVLARLAAEGVAVRQGVKVVRVAPTGEGAGDTRLTVTVAGEAGEETTIPASHLMIAAGRVVNVDGLGLEAAGINHGRAGIVVGRDLRTSNRRVYAIGDAAGGLKFTHVAGHQAGLIVRALLFRLPVRYRPDRMPRVTYTDPPLGQVGLSEAEAARRGERFSVIRLRYDELDRAQASGHTEGLLKLIVGRGGRLIGAGIVGESADEVTNLLALALSKSMRVGDLAGFVSPYPIVGEIVKRAATAYYRPYAERRSIRLALSLLRRLG
ncbi:dihydrolipoyl dehydrogenase family protein [Consotaella aegiceratis]|uniref:dihydrolipoyl dehydrogenase family protein n=1 Tax=Consotaella aegiceratis TaxID=3097961 RepID=UPI002F405AFC